MNERIKWLDHNGHKILFVDYNNLKGEEYVNLIGEHDEIIIASGKTELLTMMNFTDSKMNNETKARATELISNAKKANISLKIAAFGIYGVQKLFANAVVRDIYFAGSEEKAKDWLIKDL